MYGWSSLLEGGHITVKGRDETASHTLRLEECMVILGSVPLIQFCHHGFFVVLCFLTEVNVEQVC